jgi:hypothetical protein
MMLAHFEIPAFSCEFVYANNVLNIVAQQNLTRKVFEAAFRLSPLPQSIS